MVEIVAPQIEEYAQAHTSPQDPLLEGVASATRQGLGHWQMMVGAVEGRLLETLVFLTSARTVLEIGTFSGYSALSMARALPDGGRMVTCEIDPRHAVVARQNFAASPYAGKIELMEGPALATVRSLPGPFDVVFIDADKSGYRDYYEAVLPKLSPRGVIAIDNTLWSGRILDAEDTSEDTVALRAFNDDLVADPRVVVTMLTVRDGVTLVRQR